MRTSDEAHLSFQYDGKPMEMAFSALVHTSVIYKRLKPGTKKHIQNFGAIMGPPTHIVDVGACNGTWAIPFALWFPEAKILAIEPSKYNYPYLQSNCKNYPNIKTLKIVVSDSGGKITIANPSPDQRDRSDLDVNTGLISVYGKSTVFREEVEVDILDNLVESRVDWLKIDVEGHEMSVLVGARNILKNHRPLLQIEMRSDNQDMAKNTTFALAHLISSYNYVAMGCIGNDWIYVPEEKL